MKGLMSNASLHTVSVPARIFEDSTDVEITTTVGKTILLSCSVFGVPMPSVHWLTGPNDEPIALSDHFNQSETTLQIKDARVTHSGVYKCDVSNGVGPGAHRTFTVKVKG